MISKWINFVLMIVRSRTQRQKLLLKLLWCRYKRYGDALYSAHDVRQNAVFLYVLCFLIVTVRITDVMQDITNVYIGCLSKR